MKNIIPFLILITLISSCNGGRIKIVNNEVSDYEILIPQETDSLIKDAATELQEYLLKISGVKIPVVTAGQHEKGMHKIFIGDYPGNESYKPHMIFYRVNGDNLLIGGGSPKSVLYAVYTFLQNELACMWLSPDVEIVPESDKITIHAKIDYEYTPDIETRTVHSKLFYDNHDFADKLKVTYEAFPGYVPVARVHTFHRFMPESVFFDSHPEYYALRKGKRLTTQLCLSNPDVLRIVTDSVTAYFDRYPESDIISVSQDDNTLYCQCDECAAIDQEEGSASGTMIRFVNKVAGQFPDKTISTLAYQYTRQPCKTKPADNVLVTLCSIECDRSKAIEEGCSDFAGDLKGWKQLTENIRIWDYTTQFTNFLAPFPNIHTLGPNIRFFRDNNAKWIFEQHSHNPSELFELRSYLMAKLLWDPDRNASDIIHEFCEAYYGEGGEYIEEYINTIHDEINKVPDFFLFLYGDPSQAFDSFLRPEMLKQYNHLFSLAGDAVAGKPDLARRINVASLGVRYASLEASRAGLSEEFKLDSLAKIRLNEFEKICNDAGITFMNEMGYTVDEYIDSYKKTIKRSEMPNIAGGKKVIALTAPKKYADEDPQALTDGAYGGSSFYSNWLGFEGNDMEVVIDLGEKQTIDTVQTAFLQVTNHIVFFPEFVEISFPEDLDDGDDRRVAGRDAQVGRPHGDGLRISTSRPLDPGSKVNDIEYFNFSFKPVETRYVKIYARNMKKAPPWHNSSGLPAWIFCDEVIIN
ncbi:MAG: DUF4838 domain-containing protein [Bacteroidota bacterium]|nr:DUF4838 domain-containing protein [Bacteroidota bacterium]